VRGLEGYIRDLLLLLKSTFPSSSYNYKHKHIHSQPNNPNKQPFYHNGDHQGKLLLLFNSSPQQSLSLSLSFLSTSRHLTNILPQNAANYVSESVQGAGAQASHEANKNVAKDSDASLGTRASAAKDSIGDKFDQKSHETKADVHKGKF
jgi:hypothetical protein